MTEENDEFIQGFAVALRTLSDAFGMPSMAYGVMTENGLSYDDFLRKGLDPSDLNAIKKICVGGE